MKKIIAKECRFATYVPNPTPDHPDGHFAKEIIHYDDGSTEPNLRFLQDYQRPYYTTKKGFRNHKQHKEWEKTERLNMNYAPERFMVGRVANALGMPWFKGNRRKLFETPYIYGIDITSTASLKHEYMVKYPKTVTPYSVAELDIETDMVNDDTDGFPIMATLSMKGKMVTVIVASYLEGYANPVERIEELSMKYLGPHLLGRSLNLPLVLSLEYAAELMKSKAIKPVIHIVDNDMDMWRVVFRYAHEWKPDWLSIWNMAFEMGKFIESCARHHVDPAEIMCDPSVPEEYRYFEYKEGKSQKVTASGKVTPVSPAARWHTVTCPASFYVIDQMCVYKQTRMGKQEEPSYSLQAILDKELKSSKLYFETDGKITEGTADWHYYMQKHHPLEYVVYNRFDCIGPELIDEKVKDLAFVMPSMAKSSDFGRFPSQPRRTCDDLHWEIQNQGLIMGVSSSALSDEYDDDTLSRDAWIVTLPAALIAEMGLKAIEELPESITRIFTNVGDEHRYVSDFK